MLIEREARLGGILKQCVHDGFGLIAFGQKLSGPEYAERYIDMLSAGAEIRLKEFVTEIKKTKLGFRIHSVSPDGITVTDTETIILATGCRERTAKQVGVGGDFPAGVLTAGTAQYYVNILGKRVGERIVILGSGDVGLIMARRLTLEGARVLGVYEAAPTVGGLVRNVQQCLDDFGIPLHLNRTVTRLYGKQRLEAVDICETDGKLSPIGEPQRVECDTLILSVGLIPENEIAEKLGAALSLDTKGAIVDQNLMTTVDGVFACGNALHVSDLADYVSESGVIAASAAAQYVKKVRTYGRVEHSVNLRYVVPQRVDLSETPSDAVFFFRVRAETGKARLIVGEGERRIFRKNYGGLRPSEEERAAVKLQGKELVWLDVNETEESV
jgi:thioredoxin reductase